MSIYADIQGLAQKDLVTLYELDATNCGGGIIRFHGHMQNGSIWWQGLEYGAWPITVTGMVQTTQQQSRPTLQLSNRDATVTFLLQTTDDLLWAKLTVKQTFSKYLDARNFEAGNPTANPNFHFPDQSFRVYRRVAELPEAIEMELVTGAEIGGITIPKVKANDRCSFTYRDENCGYTGGPVANELDQPTTDPLQDRCGHCVASCKLRFGENNPLPFGGFPATALIR